MLTCSENIAFYDFAIVLAKSDQYSKTLTEISERRSESGNKAETRQVFLSLCPLNSKYRKKTTLSTQKTAEKYHDLHSSPVLIS